METTHGQHEIRKPVTASRRSRFTSAGDSLDTARPAELVVLLDEIQELRAAGAEATQIGGATGKQVRLRIDSAVTGSSGAINVDGTGLSPPYTVVTIGDPPTLAAALNIPGGVIDTVARAGGTLSVEQARRVRVEALRVPRTPQYARPAGR